MENKILLQGLIDNYNQPAIKGLIQSLASFCPPLAIGDAMMNSYLNENKERKLRIIFDTLNDGSYTLSEADIYNNDFLFAYFSTVNYVMRSRTDDKAKRFSEMLKGVYSNNISVDEFEDLCFVLEQLTDKEFAALSIKLKFEKKYLNLEKKEIDPIKDYWEEYVNSVCSELNLEKERTFMLLEASVRKGCFKINDLWGGNQNHWGSTTPLFQMLCSVLKEME